MHVEPEGREIKKGMKIKKREMITLVLHDQFFVYCAAAGWPPVGLGTYICLVVKLIL